MVARWRAMKTNLLRSLAVLLFVSATSLAQTRTQSDLSMQQRASELEPLIVQAATRYGIDPRLLEMICFVESRFKVDAVSPKGARGLMQFMPDTAARYGLTNPHDPKAAIDAAAHYLRDLLNRFGGRVDLAVAAYNAGEGAVESFRSGRPLTLANGKVINVRGLITGGIPPYLETQSYVRQIIQLLATRGNVMRGSLIDSVNVKRVRLIPFTLDADELKSPQERKNISPKNSSFIEVTPYL
jgi:soluble lytic murein transglycosylase-like protein